MFGFGRKKLSTVLSGLTTIQSDLKEVIADEVQTQKDISLELGRLENRQAASSDTMSQANKVLGNVTTLLGK